MQRLRAGEAAGLVARSLEVSRQELYRWSRDVDKFGERAFPGVGQKRAERRGLRSWNVRSGSRSWSVPRQRKWDTSITKLFAWSRAGQGGPCFPDSSETLRRAEMLSGPAFNDDGIQSRLKGSLPGLRQQRLSPLPVRASA